MHSPPPPLCCYQMQESEQWCNYNTLIYHPYPYPYPYLLTVLAANGDFFLILPFCPHFSNSTLTPFPSSTYFYSSLESPLDPYLPTTVLFFFMFKLGVHQGPSQDAPGPFQFPGPRQYFQCVLTFWHKEYSRLTRHVPYPWPGVRKGHCSPWAHDQ